MSILQELAKAIFSIGIAKALNEKFKECKQPKRCYSFLTCALFQRLKSFNGLRRLHESYAVNLLIMLISFFDDLERKVAYEGFKEANEWRQRVLFKILDNRQTTFLTQPNE
ncbi:MAG: hypothetical protein ACLVJN_06275 [Streptococcus parasanguinis]